MEGIYELAQGGIRGREHRFTGKNYQDATHIIQTPDFTVGVIADGCGSQPYSEVGAQLGARIVASVVHKEFTSELQASAWGIAGASNNPSWEQIRQDVLQDLHTVAETTARDDYGRFVLQYLLFSMMGFVIGPEDSIFFGIGDGHVIVNGESMQIGPFEKNMPPYLSYALTNSGIDPRLLEFTFHRTLPTAELEHFLIGCDGVTELESAADRPLPGKTELVGPISDFWTNDKYFKNKDNIRRRLTLVNGGVDPKPGSGLLGDDTTFITGRRRKGST